jgi:RimJ/RimL family protein N-acetyltransferase
MAMSGTPLWAVADADTDVLLAAVGVPRGGPSGLEIGYWAHRDARGQGVMTEAVGMVARHALMPRDEGGMGAHRLHLSTSAGNDASRHVAEANGFVQCGVSHAAERMADGSLADLVELELTHAGWMARHGRPDRDPTSP